jgi:methionyl aminopeptidase
MEEEVLKNYSKAKEISDEILKFSRKIVSEERQIFIIAEQIENEIKKLEAKPAFPVNISINNNAAHYTPDINDATVVKDGDLVKIDFGVQCEGYIWDRAFTVCAGKKTHPLIDASEKALQEALKMIKSGTKICEISETVQETINSLGFNPIRNLCGHGLEQYVQHAEPTIPNGKNNLTTKIPEGKAIAMEVFTTDGVGMVKESYPVMIYRFSEMKPVRMIEARKILEMAVEDFEMLPFAKRWLAKIASPMKIELALKQLMDTNALEGYPILREESNGLVAQTEETVLV